MEPMTVASDPPADGHVRRRIVEGREMPITVSAASIVADAALSRTVAFRKSPKLKAAGRAAVAHAVGPSTIASASSSSAAGVSSERTPTRSA